MSEERAVRARSHRSVRATRGLLAASIATFVALFTHMAAGGTAPGFVGVAVPWTFSVLICIAIAGHRRSVWRLSVSVALSQVLFHFMFVLGTSSRPRAGAFSSPTHAAHGTVVVGLDATAPEHVHPTADMWVAHLIAAVVTIAALHHGDSILARLGALQGRFWTTLVRSIPLVELTSAPRPGRLHAVSVQFNVHEAQRTRLVPARAPPVLHSS